MRSVADDLRAELRERVAHLDPAARLDLALRLGEGDVAILASARGITVADARHVISRARDAGRASSRCHDEAHDPARSRRHSAR